MSQKKAPYGTWSSPISAEAITKGSIAFQDVLVDPVTSTIYHLESRPSEAGRIVLVNTVTGKDVVGEGWNVRTGVQEYGGAAAIVHNNIVYFSNIKDGRVYRIKDEGEPEPVTPESVVHRFAGFAVHPVQSHILVAILEDHTVDNAHDVVTLLCTIDTRTKIVSILVKGADFYACPKFSPDGKRLAWQEWYHPDMPWEGSLLYTADFVIESGSIKVENTTFIAGKKQAISAGYPAWSGNETLIYTSDVSGYINPWKYKDGKSSPALSKPANQEFGSPMWPLHMFPYAVLDEAGRYALFVTVTDGRNTLQLVDLEQPSEAKTVETPYVAIGVLRSISTKDNEVVFRGEKVTDEPSIVKCTISDLGGKPTASFEVLKSASSPPISKDYISVPKPLTLKAKNGDPIHVVYYPPQNPEYSGSTINGERPPCVINAHGGPTDLREQGLLWSVQYFTSRGFAWLDVNYGGSSGYGRSYINRLVGKWGLVDVSDCVEASQTIAATPYNLADPKRLVIRGGSAGGYTVLAALACAPDVSVFAAGCSFYGVSDLKPLEEHAHKFESHYLYNLIGGNSAQVPELFKARSPLYHADNIVSPLLILQGEIDRVVPKEQAELIVESVKSKGGVIEYVLYEGEGHGWRQEKNIKHALETELGFYTQVLKLKA